MKQRRPIRASRLGFSPLWVVVAILAIFGGGTPLLAEDPPPPPAETLQENDQPAEQTAPEPPADLPAETSATEGPGAEEPTTEEAEAPVPDDPAEPPQVSIDSARDFFELLDLGESYLAMFRDDQPFSEEEEEAVLRVLTRLQRVQPRQVTGWLDLEIPWEPMAEEPEPFRLRYFLLSGHVTSIEVKSLIPEVAGRYDFDQYYEVSLAVDEDPSGPPIPATVVLRSLPLRWQRALGQGLDLTGQRVSAAGLFLKTTHAEDEPPGYAFATTKLSWHPERPSEELGVTADMVLWAEQGMDIAELDYIRDRVEFSPLEREAFYQLLGAVHNAGIPVDRRPPRLDVAQLLSTRDQGTEKLASETDLRRGQIMRSEGRIFRVTKILIDDDDIQRRLGLDHYYEITYFVRLEFPIVSQRGDDPASRKEFRDEYPVLACVATLPPGLEVGENIRVSASIVGPYFKLWGYRSGFLSGEDPSRRQISPLLIADSVRLLDDPEPPPIDEFAWQMLLLILAIAVVGVAFGVVMSRRSSGRQ